MKKILLGVTIGLCVAGLFAFKAVYDIKKSTAEVEQYQGLYVFTDSKPVSEFEYLGTVKSSIGLSGQYADVRDRLIKKAKSEYPQAEGIILNLKAGGTDRVDVVKFK